MKKLSDPEVVSQIVKNGFWYIDIPRTSSSSVQQSLINAYGVDLYGRKGTGRSIDVDDHTAALDIMDALGADRWKKMFTFTLVRNPWDRMHSLFQYRRIYGMNIPVEMSFDEYVKELYLVKKGRPTLKNIDWPLIYTRSSTDFIVDKSRKFIVDYVGRFEDRATFISEINKKLIHPIDGSTMLGETTSGIASYQEFYSNESREIIGELYADDILNFNYSFGDAKASGSAPVASAKGNIPEMWLMSSRNKISQLETELAEAKSQVHDLNRQLCIAKSSIKSVEEKSFSLGSVFKMGCRVGKYLK